MENYNLCIQVIAIPCNTNANGDICSKNQITSLVGIRNLTKLEKLHCGNNQLTSLVGIKKLYKLEILYCKYNQLISLTGIEKLYNLKYLCYDNNPIYEYIEINYNRDWKKYIKDLKAVQLIEKWFLEVRYSPEYTYSRRKVYDFYDNVICKKLKK